jgi:hypothetical protein
MTDQTDLRQRIADRLFSLMRETADYAEDNPTFDHDRVRAEMATLVDTVMDVMQPEIDALEWLRAERAEFATELEQLRAERDFLHAVLALAAKADLGGDLLWRLEDGRVHLAVDVSDVFAWGGADAEELSPDRVLLLERAYADLSAISGAAAAYTVDLFAARLRGMRPQGAAYPSDAEARALFDACGPERELGLGNPRQPPRAEEHVCKPGAGLYYCPTAGEVESDCHGGFDTCCDRPDLHRPIPTCAHCEQEIEHKMIHPNMDGNHQMQWVHVPGGYTICYPQQGSTSPRATPAAPAEVRLTVATPAPTVLAPADEAALLHAYNLRNAPATYF